MPFSNQKFKDDTMRIVDAVVGFLANHNIPCFLTFGTLLGFAREKDLIKYDYDFDIGIRSEDWDLKHHELVYGLMSRGLVIEQDKRDIHTTMYSFKLIDQVNPGSPTVDLYKYYQYCGKKFNGPSRIIVLYPNQGYFEHPSEQIGDLLKVEFLGRQFSIPVKFDEFLSSIYGDWRVPKMRSSTFNEYHYLNFIYEPPKL